MDELDRRLIALLRTDARTPASALAVRLNTSRGTVQNRIARMLARGDIHGFTVRTRPGTADQAVRAIMCVAVDGERSAAVIRALKSCPQVSTVHTTNGRWDLVAELEVQDLAEFSRTLDVIREIDGIASTETSLLLATHKF